MSNHSQSPDSHLTPQYDGSSKGGKKKKQLHIAHRRSPSEMTTLMVEQLNLQRQVDIQRQLEIVEQQKQQLLAQQQLQLQFQPPFIPPTANIHSSPLKNKNRSHRRSQSSIASMGSMGSFSMPTTIPVPAPPPPAPSQGNYGGIQYVGAGTNFSYGANPSYNAAATPPPVKYAHNRTSSGSGHNRRHSLGLQEAKKAAALVQSQRGNNGSASLFNESLVSPDKANDDSSPSTPPEGDKSSEFEGSKPFNSFSPAGQKYSTAGASNFQFPPPPSGDPMLMPPQPFYGGNINSPMKHERNNSGNFKSPGKVNHERKGSGHFKSNSKSGDINSNWRSQQLQSNKLQTQRSSGNLKDNVNSAANPGAAANPYSVAYDMGLAPPAAFTPSHRPRGSYGGGSISSINSIASYSGYQMGYSPQQNNQQQRKSLFAPYLPQASLPALISEGRLVTGILRVNKKNRSDAYISTDGLLDADIFICGSKDRNRALEGDLVAVELLVVDDVWNSKKEKEEKKRRKDIELGSKASSEINTNDDNNNDASISNNDKSNESSGIRRRGSLKQRPTQKKNDDLEVEGQSLLLVEEEEINDEYRPLYAGHVVAVIDRIPGQLFSGTLGLVRPSQQKKDNNNPNFRPKIVWFKPNDKKVPLIAIPTEQAPKDFVEKHDSYANKLFVASIKRWPITSLHPFGTLVSQLGVIDAPQTEIDSILKDNNFASDEYPEDFSTISNDESNEFQYLFDYPEVNLEGRKDFTSEYLVGITPVLSSCDSAIHIKRLTDNKIEIGVHVSDVSYFIKPGSLLDKKLKKRSVSVHLAQGVNKDLYPENIAQLISFKANEIGLSISVIFQIHTETFEIDDVWIGESFIKPKQIISYDDIDLILSKSVDYDFSKNHKFITSATADYVRTLSLISKQFHRQRLGDKTLEREPTLVLLDEFDNERVRLSLNIFEDNLAFPIIEELYHKVNSTIAQKIFVGLGGKAFLRRQQLPTLSKFEAFIRKVSNFNLNIDTTDSASLQISLLNIKDDVKRKSVEALLSKCMNRGKYYVAGKTDPENYGHWYYNLPLYTHFTSPSRQYADLIVHRQLKAVLNGEEYKEDEENLKMIAEYCNFKKDNALAAQQQSIHLLLCQTVNAMSQTTGQILTMGTVIQVYESSFDVLLPEFGIEKRVHGDQLPLVKAEFDKSTKTLELYWEKEVDSATYIPPDEKQPLSYRSSIKNKFRTSSVEAAKYQQNSGKSKKVLESQELLQKLNDSGLKLPKVISPKVDTDEPLKPYFEPVVSRVDGTNYIQEVRELQQVPILLRSEIGMALPCLTVRTLNPFAR